MKCLIHLYLLFYSNSLIFQVCDKSMSFVTQIYSVSPNDPEHAFHRYLYVFVCRNGECSQVCSTFLNLRTTFIFSPTNQQTLKSYVYSYRSRTYIMDKHRQIHFLKLKTKKSLMEARKQQIYVTHVG